jgi:penicillin amidase
MPDFDTDTTRRKFLKAGAGTVAATAMTETALAYGREGKQTSVVIKRDTYGVPHVYAPEADRKGPAFFGYGYAAAEDRLFQLEMYRRFYHGTVSEVLGPGKDNRWIQFDRQARVNRSGTDVPKQIETQLEDVHREVLEAFADGVNRYIETVTSTDREFHKGFVDNGFTPDAWNREDIAGMFVASMSFFSGYQLETLGAQILSMLKEQYDDEQAMALFADIQWGDDPSAPTSTERAEAGYTPPYTPAGDDARQTAERFEKSTSVSSQPTGTISSSTGEYRLPADPDSTHEAVVNHWRTIAEGLDDLGLPIKLGSNALAVTDDYFKSGDALLFGGPQMGFNSPSVMHEVGLHGPDFDITGITVAGYPFVMFGHNNNGAMSSTAGLDNSIQTFVETIRETECGDGYEYQFQDEWYPVESNTETIPVKGGDNVEMTIRRTRHGVVINWDPKNGEAVAMTRSYEG